MVASSGPTPRVCSADDDFDAIIRDLWVKHLKTLPVGEAAKKTWKSGYWKKWYREVVISAEPDDDINNRIYEKSIVESPPFADDDRRPRPAAYHQQEQGGLGESKLRVAAQELPLPCSAPRSIDPARGL